MMTDSAIPALTTTRELLQSECLGQDSYFLLGQLSRRNGVDRLSFPMDRLLCAGSAKIRDFVQEQRQTRIPTFKEVVSCSPDWPSDWMVVGAGSYLWVTQKGSNRHLSMPLLLRNGPVLDTGMYNHATGGASDDPVDTAWRETNEEHCILIERNGRLARAFFQPPGTEANQAHAFLKSMKPALHAQEPCIRGQLPEGLKDQPIELISIPTRTLDTHNHGASYLEIDFPKRPSHRLFAQVFINPDRRNVNINMVTAATLPAGRLIQVDPEGFSRKTGLFTRAKVVRADFPKTLALKVYAQKLE
jgi:hypothetical protein